MKVALYTLGALVFFLWANMSNEEEDTGTTLILGALIVVVIAIIILVKVFSTRCGVCKKFFVMRTISIDDLGKSRTVRSDENGKSVTKFYRNYRITRECKECGHQTSYIEERS